MPLYLPLTLSLSASFSLSICLSLFQIFFSPPAVFPSVSSLLTLSAFPFQLFSSCSYADQLKISMDVKNKLQFWHLQRQRCLVASASHSSHSSFCRTPGGCFNNCTHRKAYVIACCIEPNKRELDRYIEFISQYYLIADPSVYFYDLINNKKRDYRKM